MDLQTQQDALARRQALMQALLAQNLRPIQQQTAGGFVLPSYGTAAGNLLSQGFLNQGIQGAEKQKSALENQIQQGSQSAIENIKQQLAGEKPNYTNMALDVSTNPYLSQNPNVQRVALSMIQGKQANPYAMLKDINVPDPNNPGKLQTVTVSWDTRSQTAKPLVVDKNGKITVGGEGKSVTSPQYSYGSQYNKAAGAQQGKSDVDIKMKPMIESAVAYNQATAKEQARRDLIRPEIEAALAGQTEKLGIVSQNIDLAINNANGWTTGMMSKLLSNWAAGTPQYNLAKTLESIRSSIGLDRLTELKKAGGTLGSVTQEEHRLLQTDLVNLDASQSPEQLKRNLEIIRKHAINAWKHIGEVYRKEYKISTPPNPVTQPATTSTSTSPPPGITPQEWEAMRAEDKALWK